MNETPTISITFKFEGERSVRTITSEFENDGNYDTLIKIVSETQLMFYNLGYSNELVEQAVKESNIF